jgi:hemerythrin-like domain-containing protein
MTSQLLEDLCLEIDCRHLDGGEVEGTLLSIWRTLQPGRGFTLVLDHDPTPYLGRLQQDSPGEVEWMPVRTAGDCWQVMVSRSTNRMNPATPIASLMIAEHRRIAKLLEQVRQLAREGDWAEALRLSLYLESFLARHSAMEEQVLLPLLASVGGNTAVRDPERLSDEHHEQQQVVRQMRWAAQQALDDGPGAAEGGRDVLRLAHELWVNMGHHMTKEERALYRLADVVLDPEAGHRLQRTLQATAAALKAPPPGYEGLWPG